MISAPPSQETAARLVRRSTPWPIMDTCTLIRVPNLTPLPHNLNFRSSRDGKNISASEIVRGLKACYGLSTPLALFLSHVGFLILRKTFRRISLFEIGKHGQVEHNASLVHHDTPAGEVYAPIEIDAGLVEKLIDDVEGGERMNAVDVARARIRREKESPVLDGVHAEIARGEMAIILGVWEEGAGTDKLGIPVAWMRRWIQEEKLPDGWRPQRKQGLLDTVKRSKAIRTAMEDFRKAETEAVKEK